MRLIAVTLILVSALGLGACSKFKTYDGPEVTRIVVHKSSRQMVLYHRETPLEVYDVELGFEAAGPKEFEGDGKTPEGRYTIDRRNPNSAFHLSLGISYPNAEDREHARASGKSPGGDIFIHGQKGFLNRGGDDWTAGCIAVTNGEIQDIFAMVRNGTMIDIYP